MKHKRMVTVLMAMSFLLMISTGAAADYYKPYVKTQNLTVMNVPVFEAGLGIETSGNVWYVDSGATGTASGTSWTNACLTVDAAINLATASNGDLIRVAAGHAESYTAANGFDLDKAGITIYHEGSKGAQAVYTFADTDATIAVGAANCRIFGGQYLAGISAVVIGIAVEAGGDNFELIDAQFPEPLTSTFEFVDAIDLAAGADGVKIIRPCQFTADAVGADHFLDAGNGVNNNLSIVDPFLYGEYAVSAIWSDTVDLEVLIQGGVITNLTNGQHAIEFTGAALGAIKDVLVRTDVQTTAVDPGSMTMANVLWDDDAVADSTASSVVLGADGLASIGPLNSTTTDSLHGKIGTDTEMTDRSLYDLWVLDQIDIDAILADTISISGGTLPAAPVSGSLATYIAGGSTALGQPLPASTSLIDIIGDFTGPYGGTGQDDNIKASLDLVNADTLLIVADTETISTATLPTTATVGSLQRYIAGGDTGLGTDLGASKSLVDAIGSDGVVLLDVATGVAGQIGVNDADNSMETDSVAANKDGSVFERLESIQAALGPSYNHPNYLLVEPGTFDTTGTWSTVATHELLTVTGCVKMTIIAECATSVTSVSNTGTIQLGDETTTDSIIAASTLGASAMVAGELWVDATLTRTILTQTQLNAVTFVVANGKDIGYEVATNALSGGVMKFHVFWTPIDATGAVVAGAGGPL